MSFYIAVWYIFLFRCHNIFVETAAFMCAWVCEFIFAEEVNMSENYILYSSVEAWPFSSSFVNVKLLRAKTIVIEKEK